MPADHLRAHGALKGGGVVGELAARAAGAWQVLRSLGARGVVEKSRRRRRENRDYARWLAERKPPAPPQREELARLASGPLVSVLLPTCESDLRWLARALDSVRQQTYSRWELCVADDASGAPVREALAAASAADPRIRVAFRPERGHISAATNSALELARGEFVALVDHDDELAPDALLEVARALARHPDADLLYSDEDKLDAAGRRIDAHFKPDFDPDLLLSQNFVSHLGVYRTRLVREAGGFREGLEGAQDHDLALRLLERSSPGRFVHVPRVLYHWRATPESAAGGLWRKRYAHDAGRRAIAEYLARSGRRATVEPALYSAYRVRESPPQPRPAVSVLAAEPVVAGLDRGLGNWPAVEVLRVAPAGGLAAALNAGALRARGEVLLLLGPGCRPAAGWLEELVSIASRPEVGVAGGRVLGALGRVRHAGYLLSLGDDPPVVDAHRGLHALDPGHFNRARLVQGRLAVSSDTLALRREVHAALGGFDAASFPGALFEVDLCLRARERGLRTVFTPYAEVAQDGGAEHLDAPGSADERSRLRERWGERVPRDPSWHPAMDRRYPDFRLRLGYPSPATTDPGGETVRSREQA